ncbi:MAG: sigma-54 dependent transcriptional regulator [Gemmatimonadota bacterium]
MTRLLIVDDVAAMAEQYAYDLKRLAGYEVRVATNGPAAIEGVSGGEVDCLILDLEMPGMDGFEVLRVLKHRGVETPIIVYTGTGNYDRCVQAVQLGAAGFIDKAEPMERVVQEIAGALERAQLRREVRILQRRLRESTVLGHSAAMERTRQIIARVAPVPSTVLILGESGSGKEVVARELHRLGANPTGQFVAINCAALPEHLVESELFGHERGAFTGAVGMRKGAFEVADRGTLMLDEIGDLPPAVQAKLLRVLEDRTVTRVGGNKPIPVQVRVLAATHRNLEEMVKAGEFREDLFYRINVQVIAVPPLRERRDDIVPLAEHFLDEVCRRFGVLPKQISGEAKERLVAYDWRRNNVRELRNIVERMVVMADGEMIRVEHLPAEIGGAAGSSPESDVSSFEALRAEAERRIVLGALERNDWKITRTAEELGLADHASLLKIMRRLGVKRQEPMG